MKKLVSGLVFSILASNAYADDLLEIYQQALEFDPIYRAGIAQHDADKEIYDQALAVLLPNLNFNANRTKTFQDILSSDNEVYESGNTSFPTDELNLSLTQSVYSYSNWAYFSQAKAEVQQVAAELEDVRQELILRVAEAYFEVLKKRDNFVAISTEAKALEKHFERVQVQKDSGLVRSTDLLDSEARFMQVQARMIEIENELYDAQQGLYQLIGKLPKRIKSLGESLTLAKPDPISIDAWVTEAQNSNPMLIAKQNAVEAALEAMKREKGGHYPTLDFVASYNKSQTDGSLFGGGSEVETKNVMLQVNVPIYSGGAVASKVRETKSLYIKSKDELEDTWRSTARETRAAFTGVNSAIMKVEALAKSVDSYRLALEVKQESFNSGVTNSISVLDAVRDLFIAQTEFSAARYDYLYNNLRLKRAVGTLTEFDLQQINNALQGEEIPTDLASTENLVETGAADLENLLRKD